MPSDDPLDELERDGDTITMTSADLARAKALLELSLGNYLAGKEDYLDATDDIDVRQLAMETGRIEGLDTALHILESAADGVAVDDLDIDESDVESLRERAREYRGDDDAE